MVHRSFFIDSTLRGVALMTPKPSSQYRPKVWPYFIVIWFSKKDPTNSHDSAASKLPIVTLKRLHDDFLPQYSPDLCKHDFLACSIISLSASVI